MSLLKTNGGYNRFGFLLPTNHWGWTPKGVRIWLRQFRHLWHWYARWGIEGPATTCYKVGPFAYRRDGWTGTPVPPHPPSVGGEG